jgi:hypothetical protein
MLRSLKRALWLIIGFWRLGRRFERFLRRWIQILKKEKHTPKGLPLRTRYWALRRGFHSSSVIMYGLTPENVENYLPDLLYEKAHPVNGRFSAMIDGKFPLRFTLKDFPQLLPEIYYLTREGLAFGLADGLPRCIKANPELFLDLLKKKGKVFAKPEAGAGGHGVYSFEKRGDDWLVNGRLSPEEKVRAILSSLDDYLISECVEQHPYAKALFPHSANTIRLVSLRDEESLEPVLIAALHRAGTSKSQPADNFDSGGLFGEIDLATGRLGHFTAPLTRTKMDWLTHHPETNAPLTGVVVPGWKQLTENILEISRSLPFIPFMGYDVLVTETGFKIIEINSLPSLVQPFEPALLNKTTATFFAKRIPELRPFVSRKRHTLPPDFDSKVQNTTLNR